MATIWTYRAGGQAPLSMTRIGPLGPFRDRDDRKHVLASLPWEHIAGTLEAVDIVFKTECSRRCDRESDPPAIYSVRDLCGNGCGQGPTIPIGHRCRLLAAMGTYRVAL